MTNEQAKLQNDQPKLQGLVDELNRLNVQAQAGNPQPQVFRGAMASCPNFQGPFLAHNVRENIPAHGCKTAEERAWENKLSVDQQSRLAINKIQSACEARRAGSAYTAAREVNGVMYYRLNEGSEQARGGTLNQGWMWGTNGIPVHKACPF
jgi:hypothetical protein